MEISCLEHHVLGCLVCARALAAKYASDTHWLFGITDSEVVLAKYMLLTVEGDELLASILVFHYNLVALNHISIKTVHWLTVSHHYVVGDVNDVVNRTQTYDVELVLEPFR